MRLVLLLLGLLPRLQEKNDKPFDEFRWREIGPCTMGGRITDIAVVESKPQHFYVAAATGGVWKTTNNGMTWTPIFEKYGTSSIGDLAVSPTNPGIVWVGTGEANARNSVTHGDGVYKSTDGGVTFRNMGLKETRFIGRVVVHPKNPDTVYVAALGSVYVPSRERGLFKTTDGGQTWRCVKFVDEDTGFIDVALDPENPELVYAAAYEVRRDAFSGSGSPSRFGRGAGLYQSPDGGVTWTRLVAGLPTVGVGRIGIDIHRKDPRIVYAIIETTRTPDMMGGRAYLGMEADDQDAGVVLVKIVKDSPADRAGLRTGDVVLEFDGQKIGAVETLVEAIRSRKPGEKVKLKIRRGEEEKTIEVTLGTRPEEISFADPADKGGVFRSEDRGETWTQMSTLNPRPFYFSQIRVDPNDDKRVFVLGVNLHLSTDGGKNWNNNAAKAVHSDHHAMWIDPSDSEHVLLGCDGGLHVSYDGARVWEHLDNLPIGQFYAIGLDMRNPYWIYGGLQDNGTWGGPSRTRDPYIANEHWSFLHGGDGFYSRIDPNDPRTLYCESQYGMPVRIDRRTGSGKGIRPPGSNLRFEWNTPIELSPHDSKRVYIGAQMLFESENRGDGWKAISGDLAKTKLGAITTIGLSPVDPNVIWIGTNDGGVHVTKDRGKTWHSCEVAGSLWVTRVEASRVDAGTVYLTAEGRRLGDLQPYVWTSKDFGRSWTPIVAGLPVDEPVYVIRQGAKNPALLFLGTERTVYVSLNGGARWKKLGSGLPVVPVHDLAVHPRDGELVAGTHGRSLWIADIRPLEEMDVAVMLSPAHLFEPRAGTLWNPGKSSWFGGGKRYRGRNPTSGTDLWYYLGRDSKDLAIVVTDGSGKIVTRPVAKKTAGLHCVSWDLSRGRGRAAPGEYTVTLTADGRSSSRKVRVVPDPEEAAAGENGKP